MNRQFAHNIRESLSTPLLVAAEMLADEQVQHPGTRHLIERAQRRSAVPIAVVARESLGLYADSLARLDRGR